MGVAKPKNSPQSMRVWPGLRLMGAGGKTQRLWQLSDPRVPPQPQPAVLRRAADGHLGALADGHKLE